MDEQAKADYRRALGAFATGVAVITVADGDKTVCLTVNSFTSLSLDPPLVLWCLGKASDRGVWFLDADRFVVNILAHDDEQLARHCAVRGQFYLPPDRIDATRPGEPAVTGALSRLYCAKHQWVSVGDHLILIGEVADHDTRAGDGLTYFRGRFGRAVTPEG